MKHDSLDDLIAASCLCNDGPCQPCTRLRTAILAVTVDRDALKREVEELRKREAEMLADPEHGEYQAIVKAVAGRRTKYALPAPPAAEGKPLGRRVCEIRDALCIDGCKYGDPCKRAAEGKGK